MSRRGTPKIRRGAKHLVRGLKSRHSTPTRLRHEDRARSDAIQHTLRGAGERLGTSDAGSQA